MSAPPSRSPIAVRQTHPRALSFGIIGSCLALAPISFCVFMTLNDSDSTSEDLLFAITVPAFLFLLIPSIFLLNGIYGSVRASRVNKNDWARQCYC